MALLQVTVIPMGTTSPSVGDYVADIQRYLAGRNCIYQLNDMGTVIEGTAKDLLAIAAEIHEIPFQKGAKRVVTQVVLDDRRDKAVGIGDKVRAVQSRLPEKNI